ncbi:MAG: glutathione S-transferase N-terminal domain-containing protein [Alphaproteobacteria bacterium]|jgi:glutathione S-transferase
MKLFWTPASPFTRKVSIVARELGLWEQIEIIPTVWPLDWGYATVPFTAGLAEANPVARIPTLVTDDGARLGDSTLICQHLDGLASDGTIIPKSQGQWPMWSLYAVADGLLEAQVAMRAEMLRLPAAISQGFLDKQRDRIERCFDHIEKGAQQLNMADDVMPNLAQITVGVACGYQDWRDWLVDFRPDRPNIAAWYESFSRRTSMTATVPDDTPDA